MLCQPPLLILAGMKQPALTRDSQFTVGEEKLLDFILAGLFFILFLYGLIDSITKDFQNIDASSMVFVIALSLAFMFFAKGRSKTIYIRVNRKGIYHMERLVTSWPNFIRANLSQDQKALSISDNFVLIVEHKKENAIFKRKIPLGNTQNKSEEDVLNAIRFFVDSYHKKEI
jgi:hypothetical protein